MNQAMHTCTAAAAAAAAARKTHCPSFSPSAEGSTDEDLRGSTAYAKRNGVGRSSHARSHRWLLPLSSV